MLSSWLCWSVLVTPHSLYVSLQMDTSIFTEGSVLPMPSQQALSNSIGKGGNGTVTYVFYSGREFAVKKVILASIDTELICSVCLTDIVHVRTFMERQKLWMLCMYV